MGLRDSLDEVCGEVDEADAGAAPECGAVGVADTFGELLEGWGTDGEFGVWCEEGYGVELLEGAFGWSCGCFGGAGEEEEWEGGVYG